ARSSEFSRLDLVGWPMAPASTSAMSRSSRQSTDAKVAASVQARRVVVVDVVVGVVVVDVMVEVVVELVVVNTDVVVVVVGGGLPTATTKAERLVTSPHTRCRVVSRLVVTSTNAPEALSRWSTCNWSALTVVPSTMLSAVASS